MSLIDLEKFKADLGITDSAFDNRLTELIDRVEEFIAKQAFGSAQLEADDGEQAEDKTEWHNGKGGDVLNLDEYPVDPENLTSLEINGEDQGDPVGNDDEFSESGWFLEKPEWGKLRMINDVFPRGVRNIKICYKPGWPAGEVPGPVVEVCYRCLAGLWNQKEHIGLSQVAFDSNAVSLVLKSILDETTMAFLNPYRRPRI